MTVVPTVSFQQGRICVRDRISESAPKPETENVSLLDAAGRVLAEPIGADRDYPPVARSIRDGFAVRSEDLPGRLKVVGEIRAGQSFTENLRAGETVEIMTGAPVPAGADQIVMVEHTRRENGYMLTDRAPSPGEFVNRRGSEARLGEAVLQPGRRITFAGIAWMATVGRTEVRVYRKPRVAILATGDEIVEVGDKPKDNQVRNSNSQALAVQVAAAGGAPEILPIARDEMNATRELIARGLEADMLLLSGGVSAGKYDLVERVLAEFGAEFYFDRVMIQPGQPLVFGRAKEKFFFGLPGNPASTMVTFEVFAKLALQLLGGETAPIFALHQAQLTQDFRHKPGLTRFLPATVANGHMTPVPWHGSSDVPALARANVFLVADADRESWAAGDLIGVLAQ